jgi:hypothetical protein
MARFGVLDPPADGDFGPLSKWALGETLKQLDFADKKEIDRQVAGTLLRIDPEAVFPLTPGADFAGRIVRRMRERGHWICRHPDCLNIVYVEGCDTAGKANGNAPNQFNDVRLLLRIQPGGVPQKVNAWNATTEPGKYYTEHPEHPNGAARIAFDQFKSWIVGRHGSDQHEALIQVEKITVYRDKNRDYRRDGDAPDTGLFGINQHWGYDLAENNIQNASAGCLVGRLKAEHAAFMTAIKHDPRHRHGTGYRFMTTVMPVTAL